MIVTRRGRPPMGEDLIESLEGGDEEKRRLRVVIRTITGESTIREAGEELGLSDRRIHQIRHQALEGALAALEPRPAGRPRRRDEPVARAKVEELERELESTRQALELTEIGRELDLGLLALEEKKGSSAGPNRAERRQMARERRRRR